LGLNVGKKNKNHNLGNPTDAPAKTGNIKAQTNTGELASGDHRLNSPSKRRVEQT